MPDEPIKKEEVKSAQGEQMPAEESAETGPSTGSTISPQAGSGQSCLSDAIQETELEEIKRERDEYLDGWKRAKADFLNYQKDEKKRLEEFLKFVQAGLIEDLLPVLDSFDLALNEIVLLRQGGDNPDGEKLVKGLFLIKSQLDDILKKRGLESIKAVGKKFNPEYHEAVMSVEDKIKEADTIVEEIQKGYLLNGRVLRPAKVKIVK
jgi:molecular chaperone GrpE